MTEVKAQKEKKKNPVSKEFKTKREETAPYIPDLYPQSAYEEDYGEGQPILSS